MLCGGYQNSAEYLIAAAKMRKEKEFFFCFFFYGVIWCPTKIFVHVYAHSNLKLYYLTKRMEALEGAITFSLLTSSFLLSTFFPFDSFLLASNFLLPTSYKLEGRGTLKEIFSQTD